MNTFTRNNPPSGFYVYAYLRTDGTPYYIGKGKGPRAWVQHRSASRGIHVPKDSSRIVILSLHESQESALTEEQSKILQHGRKDLGTGILLNMTDGVMAEVPGRLFRSRQELRKVNQ